MKNVIIFCFSLLTGLTVKAQQDTALLKEYVGVYKFEPGDPISVVTISYNSGVLSYTSDRGEGHLTQESTDTFAISEYNNGKAYFKRDSVTKEVSGITVVAMGYRLEGTKELKTSSNSFAPTILNKEFLIPERKTLTGR